ncbi:ATP-binding protein, partial [Streptomyces sp.]|uniref:ATP-binding protein n=1 Tax=Streptomyces sp. TaxID=1931 RepID=UPI002F3F5B8C
MERQPGVTQWTALVGRTRERAALDALITAANPADRILVLRGEAGMGKSVLLDWAAERAAGAGVRVLRAVGVESESDLAFATLHQLLYPLLDRADSLAPAQRDALNQAFGVLEGRVPERFAISTAALALLQAVSREQRLLIVTDDVQWIDKSSALVLSFVLRRMGELPIAFLAATRGGWLSPLDLSAVRALEIPALEGGEAEQLLTAAHPGLAAEAARRILAEADGNPLALVELPRHLNRRQRSGREPLPPSLAMGEQLEHAFAGRLRSLPEVTRYSLLLAALGGRGPGGLRTIRAAAMKSWPGWTEDALDFADGSGLVRLDLHREEIVFRHPLVRSALVNMAPLVLLRGAHRALADALGDEPERQAWHLADAATGPDE